VAEEIYAVLQVDYAEFDVHTVSLKAALA